ncbi:hypothetical protein D1AOALGA4SA_4076 [Olavius algarvensis Delta 1 endosymbiont]|nr:hypothetical protein D1AOALGA4SA_4076 [Olavius algarvensis Delta 1 endosymbiont]
MDTLPFAIRATHLRLRKLFGARYYEVLVPAWHWFPLQVILSRAPDNYFLVNHWPKNRK